MNGDEFTKTAESTVEMAYLANDVTFLPRADILSRLTRIWRHRRVACGRAPTSALRTWRAIFSHFYTRCLCIQPRTSNEEKVASIDM